MLGAVHTSSSSVYSDFFFIFFPLLFSPSPSLSFCFCFLPFSLTLLTFSAFFSLLHSPFPLLDFSSVHTTLHTTHTHTHTHAHLRSGFKINTAFAARLTHNKQREEKHRLQEKYGENPDETDSESSDDSDADLLDAETEKDFFITLSKLKTNDPEIYNKE